MLRLRNLARAVTPAVALAMAGCAAPPADVLLADLMPVVGSFRGTDIISRAAPESLALLGKGFSVDADTPLYGGFLAVGVEADLDVVVVRDGAHSLVLEAIPPDGMERQLLSVRVNGVLVGEPVALTPGWKRHVIPLRADNLRLGHNRIRFLFRDTVRPAAVEEGSTDVRPLAARFRFIQLLPSESDRELTAEADASLLLLGVDTLPDESPAIPAAPRAGSPWQPTLLDGLDGSPQSQILMEADSFTQIALTVPEEARLVGTATVAVPENGAVRWHAELVDGTGAVHVLAEGAAGGLNADLADYAAQEVLLRFRTSGTRGAAVIWDRLGLSDPTGGFDAQFLEPPALPVPRASGDLGKPDIVIIMADAMRPDFSSAYRGIAPTPAMESLAADGTRFENAYAAAPWTGQSVHSLLSGRYPEGHGVAGWRDRPPRDLRTLFQLTYAAGYHTVLWSSHPVYRGSKAPRYDVDTYIDVRRGERYEARARLDRIDMFEEGKPTFAIVHVLPPHAPYVYDGVDGPPERWANSMMRDFSTNFDLAPGNLQSFSFDVGEAPPTRDDIAYVTARYQDNMRYADELIGMVIENLRRAGRYDNAMIFLVSDHGEAFYEHGHFLHTWPMYNEMLRIPMIAKWPADATGFQRAVDRPVSNVDIAPTVVDAIGYQGDDPGHQGQSLLPLVFDGFFPTRNVYASTVGVSNGAGDDAPLQPMGALFMGRYKVIHDKVSGRVELYDLEQDPGETEDLFAAQPLLAQQALQRLFLQEQANLALNAGAESGGQAPEMDPELVESLRALGYIQ